MESSTRSRDYLSDRNGVWRCAVAKEHAWRRHQRSRFVLAVGTASLLITHASHCRVHCEFTPDLVTVVARDGCLLSRPTIVHERCATTNATPPTLCRPPLPLNGLLRRSLPRKIRLRNDQVQRAAPSPQPTLDHCAHYSLSSFNRLSLPFFTAKFRTN